MSIDLEVEKAVSATIAEFKQSDKVAKRIISWLKELSERELNGDENIEHFNVLKNSIDLGNDSGN
jgi:hypothetical protein